ncbi:hypothetical protein NDU88_001914 [Pleurodeles waltl]|uniref:Uncharacterized protein n=1 Tax=Pleurodeles waltl TaxID=8319 RepID=A0AAV7VBI8_PLEWA|nr:hypothetical protein NDU88_001914 [Pleurodeles waltl]
MTAAQNRIVIIGPYGFQEPMAMYAGGDGEDLHCKCCCDLCLEPTMAHVSGERAPAFTAEELEKLVDGVPPQYTLFYGPPDKQCPPEKGYLACHRQKGVDPGGLRQAEHPLPQEVRGPAPLDKEDSRGPVGDGLPTRIGCPSHHDIPDVPHPGGGYPQLEGLLKASQQPQGGEYRI